MMHVRDVKGSPQAAAVVGAQCPRDRARLVEALRARLEALYGRCQQCQAEWMANYVPEEHPLIVEWRLAAEKAERTRKTLIKVERGMPYWKWAAKLDAEFAAAGIRFYTPQELRALEGRLPS